MTTLPNLNLTLPVRGAPGSGLWGDTEDANLALLDAHDHSSGKGVRIKTAGISIDADLSFSSLYAPIALNRITFSSIAALSSNNKSLFVSNADNELYWRSNAGANVKLTSGSSLNVAAFTGGIGGDYTAVSASVQYDDANKRYTFKQGGGTTWARLQSGPLRLVELGTSETVFVEQAVPSALAASYTVTWPLALPGSSVFVKIDNTGQLAFTAVTTSLVYQHSAALAILGDATATLLTNGSTVGPELSLHASTAEHVLPLTLPVGTITAFAVNLNKSSAAGTISVKLFESNNLSTPTQIGSTQSNGASNPGAVTLSQSGLSAAMTSGRQYYIVITGGGTNGDNVTAYSATVTT